MPTKPYFDPVDPKPNFPEIEKTLQKEWEKKGIVKKYLDKNKASKKYYSFLDGPITANNPMGVHHAWGRTYKDLYQRYKNMNGFRERFQNGFDCQGLWVEVEVEKELGLKTKRDIESLVPGDKKKSIAKFVELCRDRVNKFADIQTQQSKRLAYFMDWDNSYYTMSDENNYMIWHFLKKCHDDGLIYKGTDSVPWCPRCGTAISQHEMLTEDYKDVTHESVYFELPIEDHDSQYLLVWTTTPWTIPANVAVAVDPKLDYSLVKGETGNKYWVASELVNKVFKKSTKEIEKTVKGKDLVGLKYRAPFDNLPEVAKVKKDNPDRFHRVIASDARILPITTSEGTGLVHTATGAGTEDFALGKKLGLPVLPVIEEDASYMSGFGYLTGKNAKKNPELILDFLLKNDPKKNDDWVFRIEKYRHRYPACWRCKTELVWRVVDEWYIAMDKPSRKTLRERMIAVVKKIEWMPEFGLKRELDWLKNMHDWLISKKRYWGLSLPIWECKSCGNFEVIGSREELKEKSISGWEEYKDHSPHRPYIDEVKIKCSKCGKEIERIPDVGNPWLDAGIVPFSTISSDNKQPLYLDNRTEWEKWFPADFITESFPGQFKNWFYSVIAMSTVLEDKEPYKRVLGFATLFDEHGKPMHKSAGNMIEFNEGADKIGVDVMRLMYTRQNPSDNLPFGYHKADEVRRQFHLKLWNIYNFFITYANLDGWCPSKPELDTVKLTMLDKWILSRLDGTIGEVTKNLEAYRADNATLALEDLVEDLSNWYIRRSRDRVGPELYGVLYFTLGNLCRLLAPFAPHISEIIYQNLEKSGSVHLASWPKKIGMRDKKLELEINNLRVAVENAHAERKALRIPVRQPLAELKSTLPFSAPPDNLHYLLMEEVNVKKWTTKKASQLKSTFDTKISPSLKEEADTRELIRKVQQARRAMGISLVQKIKITSPWLPKEEKNLTWLAEKTLSSSVSKGEFKIITS